MRVRPRRPCTTACLPAGLLQRRVCLCWALGGQLPQEKGCPAHRGSFQRAPAVPGARGAPRMLTGLCSYLCTAEYLTNDLDHNWTECVAEARLVPLYTFTQQREKAHCSFLSPNVSLGEVQEKSLFEWDLQVILAEGLGLSLPYTEWQDLQHR